ncbi:MAG: hypothetical protein NT091_03260, partial [Candidatus Falkowbacteria bacterium]|nr:hypothetical protein [Candidatus Falkowbacteria bacterium]
EDDENWFAVIAEELEEYQVVAFHGSSLKVAADIFTAYQDSLSLIIVNACTLGGRLDPRPLVKKIIKFGYTKPIIAYANTAQYIKQLKESGATHEAYRDAVAEVAINLIRSEVQI